MIPRLKSCFKARDLLSILPSRGKNEDIKNFESAFATIAGQNHAIFFPHGRTAQLAILNALNLVAKGKTEVILPSYSCVVVACAIKKAGLTPVFVDVGDDYNMRFDLATQATNQKTGAVIVTSIFGHPVDLGTLDSYRKSYPDIPVLQDCAHSFFAQHHDGRFVQKNGLCAFYGLNISKIMTSIFGGMVTTDDDDFAEHIKEERERLLKATGFVSALNKSLYFIAVFVAFNPFAYGFVNLLERSGLLNKFTKYYDENTIDWPDDGYDWPTGIQARIGQIQCRRYQDIVNHRRKIAKIYHRELANTPNLYLPPRTPGATVSHFVVQTDRAAEIEQALLTKGYQLGRLIDYEVPDMPVYKSEPYFGTRYSRSLPGKVINLPVHYSIRSKDAIEIATAIKQCLSK